DLCEFLVRPSAMVLQCVDVMPKRLRCLSRTLAFDQSTNSGVLDVMLWMPFQQLHRWLDLACVKLLTPGRLFALECAQHPAKLVANRRRPPADRIFTFARHDIREVFAGG